MNRRNWLLIRIAMQYAISNYDDLADALDDTGTTAGSKPAWKFDGGVVHNPPDEAEFQELLDQLHQFHR